MEKNIGSNIDDLIVKVAVDCGIMGVEAATSAIRVWLENKRVFDNRKLSRSEFEFMCSVMEEEFRKQVYAKLGKMRGGNE